MKKVILLIIVVLLIAGCKKYLSIDELETKLEKMATVAFAKEEYKSLPTGSYVIKLNDLITYTNNEDIFINPKTKKNCDKSASMAILDIKDDNGVLKRTVSTILVCD
jgi:hypothetical protein